MRRAASVALVVLLCVPPLATAQAAWTRFAPPGGGLSVLVPSEPERLPVSEERGTAALAENHMYRFRYGGAVYVFGWTQYDRRLDIDAELNASRDSFLKAMNSVLISETRISSGGGMSGRELIADRGGDFVISRMFFDGTRVFVAAVMVVAAGDDDIRAPMRFLFSLDPSAASR